jgi:hypothetical protein
VLIGCRRDPGSGALPPVSLATGDASVVTPTLPALIAATALERIARDSRKDHPTIMEVLTVFIRDHTPPSVRR